MFEPARKTAPEISPNTPPIAPKNIADTAPMYPAPIIRSYHLDGHGAGNTAAIPKIAKTKPVDRPAAHVVVQMLRRPREYEISTPAMAAATRHPNFIVSRFSTTNNAMQNATHAK